MKPIQRVLVSVSDKTGLIDFLRPLHQKFKFEIISTGGTAEFLKQNDFVVTDVSAVTGFPEVLDGRVKTLHPHVHMGLLAKADSAEHRAHLEKHNVKMFDMVIGNLYPFEKTAEKENVSFSELIEKIDIGGPSFLRASAKNHASVMVVVDPNDYKWIADSLLNETFTDQNRLQLALKVFSTTAYYDSLIFKKLSEFAAVETEHLTLPLKKKMNLRYGENAHQEAALYEVGLEKNILSHFQIHQGKELSYNNFLDLDAALDLVLNLPDPSCVAVKHNNPCGVGWADDLATATARAIESDPKSVFGGILAFNRPVDVDTVQHLASLFLECLIAPSFTAAALEMLGAKKNLRVVTFHGSQKMKKQIRSIQGHMLIQTNDFFTKQDWTIVGKSPDQMMTQSIEFGEKICGFLKSNAIAIVGQGQTLGLGMGQVNRVDAVEQALKRLEEIKTRKTIDLNNVVLVSDAFFPFPDSVDLIAKTGIKWIVQPGGSTKDNLVLEAVKTHNLNMVLTGTRHFRH